MKMSFEHFDLSPEAVAEAAAETLGGMAIPTQFIIQFCIEFTFGTLHILMTIFLIAMRKRRKSMYTTAYFLIQICINFMDLGNVINVSFVSSSET